MKKQKGFTLIEVIVSITIFSIIMISVISIYIVSTDTSYKSDVNRSMQENIKIILTEIGEDIMKNGIKGVSNNPLINKCELDGIEEGVIEGSTLCTGKNNNYYLAVKNIISAENNISYKMVDSSLCSGINEQCYIVKNGEPITNSLVSIKALNFYVTEAFGIKKITISIILEPSRKAGVKPDLIKESKIIFQTTISERPLLTK